MAITNNNILLHQFQDNKIKAVIPDIIDYALTGILTLTIDKKLIWSPINFFQDSSIYHKEGRLGIGREPLFNYSLDIAIPKDTLMTGFHVGDGSFGFSFGNGASQGFIPEIIGVGSDENDPGLYFLALPGNNVSSDTPLVVIEGRTSFKNIKTKRPILGIKNRINNYTILVDYLGNLNISGDIIINAKSLLETIETLKQEIEELKQK
jgi:hypothetical protein